MTHRPPEELDAGPVTLRRWRASAVAELEEAVLASVDHLRPWMWWAALEPMERTDREAVIARWEDAWEEGSEHHYAIVDGDGVAGGCGLHRRIDEGGIEIGYWVRPDRTGRAYARAAARALTEAAFALDDVTHVEIHHDVANVRSGRIPERLGFTLVEERQDEVQAPGEVGIERVWRLRRDARSAGGAGAQP